MTEAILPRDRDIQTHLVVAALIGLTLVAAAAGWVSGPAMAIAALIGGFAGLALYHAGFGFTAAWRRILSERRGAGLRAQMLLLFLTCAVTFPLMAWGGEIGISARGYILPIGVASAFGAFVFGLGMQLGGGCASGTLFTVGGGSTRMVVVLAFFIAGSVLATAHWDFWTTLPRMRAGVSLPAQLGTLPALVLMAVLLGGIALVTVWIERRAHGALAMPKPTGSFLNGPWSLIAGAVALAIVGVATMVVLGRPWGVTSGFALWGAKIAEGVGFDVRSWTYWGGWRTAQLDRSVFANGTSVMNFGIILGAFAAAALAGKFAPVFKLSARDLATAVIGGLMMGYGARLAYGCNIGAFLGGIVSGSLHGWGWLVFGFLGSVVGTGLRRRLGMDPPPAASA